MAGTEITVVACGAPLSARTPDVVAALQGEGYHPTVVGTTASMAWLDSAAIAELTGEPARVQFRTPAQPKRGGEPAAVVVCPATFNTVNKTALGLADSYALSVVCEAIGSGVPTVMAPMVNNKLWGHPAWSASLATLRAAGVIVMDVQTGGLDAKAVASGTGDDVVRRFEPAWIVAQLKRLLSS